HLQGGPQLVPPLRQRRQRCDGAAGADRAVIAGAVILRSNAVVGEIFVEIGSDEARRQRADIAQLVAVARAEVEAAGLDAADVGRRVDYAAIRRRAGRTGRVAVDQRTGRSRIGQVGRVGDAVGKDRVRTEALDRV